MVSRDDVERLGDYILGTCKSILECCEILELDEGEDWDDHLLDVNVERCVVCDWWHESLELEWIDQIGGGVCYQCKEDEEREDKY